MIQRFIDIWNWGLMGKVFVIMTIAVIVYAIYAIRKNKDTNPLKKLKFIRKCVADKTVCDAKMTCFTRHKRGNEVYFEAEYMYMVDDEVYFVTYELQLATVNDSNKDETDANWLMKEMPNLMTLYYDKNDPHKTLCRREVFVSEEALHKIDTPTTNMYRDVTKTWTSAIDLTYV